MPRSKLGFVMIRNLTLSFPRLCLPLSCVQFHTVIKHAASTPTIESRKECVVVLARCIVLNSSWLLFRGSPFFRVLGLV